MIEEGKTEPSAPQNTTESNSANSEWDSLVKAASTTEPANKEKTETATEKTAEGKPQSQETAENKSITDSSKTDTTTEAGKTEAAATEKKEEAGEVTKPLIEFSLSDLNTGDTKAALPAVEGGWMDWAKTEGIEPKEDSYPAFKEALLEKELAPLKTELETVKSLTFEKVLEGVSPETATRLKLMEMGYTEAEIFEPTREIDSYIKMADADLIRLDFETRKYPADIIESKMEELTLEPQRLALKAKEIRFDLEVAKQGIAKQNQNIIQQYEDKRSQAITQQKEQRTADFKKAMDTVSEFIGGKVPDEVKAALVQKHQAGVYEKLLSDPKKIAEFVLWNELGQKAVKVLQNTAFEKGRDGIMKKLVVAKEDLTSGSNVGSQQSPNQSTDRWAAAKKVASEIGN